MREMLQNPIRYILGTIALAFLAAAALSADLCAQRSDQPLPTLGTFVDERGVFTPDPGYTGSIDARGWDVVTDRSGAPRFVRKGETINSCEAAPFARVADDGDEYWEDGFGGEPGSNGVNDEVFALASDGAQLYIGGIFSKAGDTEANNIVIWTGSRWQIMGAGPGILNGVNGPVNSIKVDTDEGIVYVGGQFTNAGGSPARNIARYLISSKQWASAGAGVSGTNAFVSSIEIDDANVYVGGTFSTAGGRPAANVAAWNKTTSQWSSLGNGIEGNVNALAAGPGGLYVGGSFSSAGGVASNGIALWDGVNWQSMAGGVNGFVNAIAVLDSSVFVGGGFDMAGDTAVNNVARWRADSGIWSRLSGLYQLLQVYERIEENGVDDVVRSIEIDGSNVYIAGTFRTAAPGDLTGDEIAANYVARWHEPRTLEWWQTNTWWAPLGRGGQNGTNGFINALTMYDDGLYVGGAFSRAGGLSSDGVAKWDGVRWSNLSTGAKSLIFTLSIADDGDVYVGGEFNEPGASGATRLARLGENNWELVNGSFSGNIYTVATSGDWIYVGGTFAGVGGTTARNVVRWNRSTREWSALGSMPGPADDQGKGYVSSIAIDGENVYLGGEFSIAGGDSTTRNIVCWNSATDTWTKLGAGIGGSVFSIIPSGSSIYVGGRFLGAGSVPDARNVALWKDGAWHALGKGTSDVIWSMSLRGEELFVGGEFVTAGEEDANNVAVWNTVGESWSPLGEGITGEFLPSVNSVVASERGVYVGGTFTHAGGEEAANVAAWNGWWRSLGSGVNSYIYKVAVKDGRLYVAGAFTLAGQKPSIYFGVYNDPVLSVRERGEAGEALTSLQNAPNPFHGRTTLTLRTSARGHVRLAVFDVTGREVATIVDNELPAGRHSIVWDAADLPAGTYFCRAELEGEVLSQTLVVQ